MNPSQPNTPSKEFLEQISNILESGELPSDCNFLVGPETDQQLIPGYKLILATASPVFRAMFYGSLAEKVDPIKMPDVQPAHFKVLLNYIYSNKMKLSSLEEASGVYYSAKKFLLPHLQQLCSEYFLSEVDSSNACQVYEYAQLFEDITVTDKATEIMTDATKLVLNDPSFEEIKLSTLLHIFSLDKLSIDSEIDLFEAAVRYNKAVQNKVSQNEAVDKTELSIQNAVEKIRFLTVTSEQLAECHDWELLLSESEALAVILNISSKKTNTPYPSRLCSSRESRVAMQQMTFSFTIKDFRKELKDKLYSTDFDAYHFSWRICVRPEPFPYDQSEEQYLCVSLVCNTNTESLNWKCCVEFELTLLSTTSSLSRCCQHEFTTQVNHWGWSKFIARKEVMDPSKGYMKDGAITIKVSLKKEL